MGWGPQPGGQGSHDLIAEGTKYEVKRPKRDEYILVDDGFPYQNCPREMADDKDSDNVEDHPGQVHLT